MLRVGGGPGMRSGSHLGSGHMVLHHVRSVDTYRHSPLKSL